MAKQAAVQPEEVSKTADPSKLIWVRSGIEQTREQKISGGHTVALFDRDERHPNAESCFVAGPTPVLAYPTAAVLSAIQEGTLVKIKDDEGE